MLRRRFGSFESPWREMERLRREMNYLFDRSSAGFGEGTAPDYPSLNVWTNEDGAVVTAELPGIAPEDIDISVEGSMMTLGVSRQPEALEESGTYHRRERRHGRFSRSFQLPFQIDPQGVEAISEKGVLHVSLPRAEEEKPKRIDVKGV
jgi:HSP20 family protein